jgi:hypothetical protein
MTWIVTAIGPTATAILGGAALGAYGASKQAGAAESASQLQYQSTQDAARQQREMFDILNAQQTPYREAGYGALTNINQMLPYFTQQAPAYKPFTAADLKTNLAPNYEFMKQQGLGATGQAMNVGGGGSNVNLARTKFAEDYASNAYQNALNNYMTQQQQGFTQGQTQQSNIYNRLASLAGIGQAAQTQAQNLGTSTAANIGQLGIGGATALGAGQVGAANAMAGAYGQIGNAATLASLINPQGYTPSQITNANAMNVPTSGQPLGAEFAQYRVG